MVVFSLRGSFVRGTLCCWDSIIMKWVRLCCKVSEIGLEVLFGFTKLTMNIKQDAFGLKLHAFLYINFIKHILSKTRWIVVKLESSFILLEFFLFGLAVQTFSVKLWDGFLPYLMIES
jgi:hypothetical protein